MVTSIFSFSHNDFKRIYSGDVNGNKLDQLTYPNNTSLPLYVYFESVGPVFGGHFIKTSFSNP